MKFNRRQRKRDNQKCPKCGIRKNIDQFPDDSSWCYQCEKTSNTILHNPVLPDNIYNKMIVQYENK